MVEINRLLFLKVFGLIFEEYKRGGGMFADHSAAAVGPQRIYQPKCVERGSRDHLYWLALVAFSDKRTNSTVLYRNFARMFERNKTLFERGRYPSLRRMTELFRKYQIALPVMEIAFFIERKRHLDELFDGDPLRLYVGSKDSVSLMKNLRHIARQNGIQNIFPGAKAKIFSLLAMFLREFQELDFSDVVPVDVWVQSIAASTGVLVGSGHIVSQTLERRLRPLLAEAFVAHRSVEGAANATWIVGKFGCTHCHRLSMKDRCPVYELCQGPFERMRNPISGKHYGAVMVPPRFKPKYQE